MRDAERDILQIILSRALDDEVSRRVLRERGGFQRVGSKRHKCMIVARTIREYLLWYLIVSQAGWGVAKISRDRGDSVKGLAILSIGERMGTLSGRES